MNKLKAYTITELVISMVVTGIIISIAGTILFMFNKQHSTFQSSNKELHQINLLHTLLNKDFEQSESVKWSNNTLSLESIEVRTEYSFEDNYVTRLEKSVIDTFHVPTTEINFEKNSELDLITLFEFDFQLNNQKSSILLRKEYTPDVLLNHSLYLAK